MRGSKTDRTYDANGNMTRDLNKGIGTTLTDNVNIITYNFLNLPETVTRGGNNIRYVYDATGRKLWQGATYGGTLKQSDYAGEYIYENDALQFINHEEGRISIASNTLVYTNPAEATTDFIAVSATLALVTQNGTEKYVRVTSNGTTARTGVFPVGGTFTVVAGEKYRIRVKGYRTGSSAAYIQAKAGVTDIIWPGAAIASNVASESWTEQTVTIPVGATQLLVGVNWNTVVANEAMFINEIDITKVSVTADPEYQYHLKDHLGNVRTTFTSVVSLDQPPIAKLEAATLSTEQTQFLRITTAKRVSATLFDHTNGAATGYSERLNGSANEKYGVAKSISVMPGDVINAEVYGKYVDANSGNWIGILPGLMSQIAANQAGVVVDGANYASSTGSFPYLGILSTAGSTGGPKAYLNWIVFDRNFVMLTAQSGYTRMTAAPKEQGQDVAHELMASPTINITQPGYVYIYLSNEETTPVEVYFDDFRVTHTKSPVIQTDDYYPFGLSISGLSYQRENSIAQDFKYNGKELQDELGLGWLDYGARMYMAEIGRWGVVDPHSENYLGWTTYNYAANNPVIITDPTGMDWYQDKSGSTMWKKGSDEVEGYKNIGASYTQNVGDGVSISYNQNEAVSMEEKVLGSKDFRTQQSGEFDKETKKPIKKEGDEGNCYVQAGKMVEQSGATPLSGDANGIKNSKEGVGYVDQQIDQGNSVRVHVDRDGDGKGNHWVAISSRITDLQTGSKSYGFFDPAATYANKGGTNNTFNVVNGNLSGRANVYKSKEVTYVAVQVRRNLTK